MITCAAADPKPTRLKVLTGTPGKRPLNLNEPRPEPAVPERPLELGPVAAGEWGGSRSSCLRCAS